MYALSEFIPNGCFVTSNPVPVQNDIRDISCITASDKDVYVTIKDSHTHIRTQSKAQAKKVVKDIMIAIANEIS